MTRTSTSYGCAGSITASQRTLICCIFTNLSGWQKRFAAPFFPRLWRTTRIPFRLNETSHLIFGLFKNQNFSPILRHSALPPPNLLSFAMNQFASWLLLVCMSETRANNARFSFGSTANSTHPTNSSNTMIKSLLYVFCIWFNSHCDEKKLAKTAWFLRLKKGHSQQKSRPAWTDSYTFCLIFLSRTRLSIFYEL